MRHYSVAFASLTIGAPTKWTDNLLSQHQPIASDSGRQGIARRVSYQALLRLDAIRQLHIKLGIGVRDAVQIAAKLLDSGHPHVLALGQLSLSLDVAALRRSLDDRLALALESAPTPRRGRPPRRPPTGRPSSPQ